jgi:hypothetical protein
VYLAELYLPSGDARGRKTVVAKAERAAAKLAQEGAPVRLVRSAVVPGDEMCFLFFEADSAETVARLGEAAGLAFDRVVEASAS